jgi:hypothetical protein
MADENIVDELVDTKVVPGAKTGDADAKAGATDVTPNLVTDAPKDDGKEAKTERPAPVDWPADWREKAASGDAKKLARLTRYASPQAIADALIAAQNKISAGDLKVTLGKDAKPEEVAAYREAHGIPEAPDKYDLAGVDIDSAEKPMIDKFLVSAHQAHMTAEQVRATINAYSGISEDAKNARLSADNEAKEKAEDALRSEWGNEFRTNINLITNLLDTAPQGLRDKLLHGRLADGTPIGSSPEALQFLAGLARDRNPSGVVVPSGVATESAIEDEIGKIEKTMRENRAAYNRDEKMQARYRDLLVWREARKGPKAA